MKRHTAILLTALLCLLALFSCAPVEYPSALERNVVEDKPVIYVTPHAKKAEVSFTPARNADSYVISLNGVVQNVPLKVREGLYTFTLRKLDPDKTYDLKISAINSKGSIETVNSFTTLKDNGELDYAPIAYMSYRDKNSAWITIKERDDMDYIVSIEKDGRWEQVGKAEGLEGVYKIESLESETFYKARVDHKRSNDTRYSTEFTSLVIPKYRKAFSDSYELMIEASTIRLGKWNNSEFTEASLPAGKNITLLFYPDDSGVPEIMETKPGNDPKFDVSRLGVLRSGLFDVVITDNDGSNPVFSIPSYFTTPVTPIINSSLSNQKTVTLEWTQPDDMEEIIYTISGESTDKDRWKIKPSEVEISGNKATLKLDDLVSNTEYALSIEALLPNGENSRTTFNFTTESFSGVYRWVCPTPNAAVPSFVIEVWDHDDAVRNNWADNWNDMYPYHVFVHESDPAYSKDMEGIAIMPLFRGDDTLPTDFISYSENDTHYKQGYHWNEMKWNATGTIHPSAWKPDAARDVHGPDTRTSYTLSKALGTLTTKTDFTFRVKDGEPQIVFRNAGDGKGAGTVNIGLFKNPAPEPGTDKFTFVLNRIGSAR